eukprot:CAMPEP_0206534926 /NCGR_PEP_ID=MMETSP0325_2-20121206/5831_1 /ASSEMBLY_ACC=CAM_ASM_000347 /TAXON_ID=2866 /ORGANISM="Crypthecodinium cohnii, Strain Seligo" /LENGTH=49 /DNA_ID= /DNA_START= /DNA_END= /DNA_ORIENTATION=
MVEHKWRAAEGDFNFRNGWVRISHNLVGRHVSQSNLELLLARGRARRIL